MLPLTRWADLLYAVVQCAVNTCPVYLVLSKAIGSKSCLLNYVLWVVCEKDLDGWIQSASSQELSSNCCMYKI